MIYDDNLLKIDRDMDFRIHHSLKFFGCNYFEKTSYKGKLGAYFMKSIRNSNISAVLRNNSCL
jgi:hypothetical protein